MQSCTTARSGIGAPVLGFLRSLCQVPGFGFWVSTLLNPQNSEEERLSRGIRLRFLPFFFCGRYSQFTPACRIGVCREEPKVQPLHYNLQ